MASSLLERIARGEQTAVPECLALYGGLVYALARKYSGDSADVEDAVQEVFIDLWRSASRFDPTVAAEATFVAMIARRRLVDRSRKVARTLAMTPMAADADFAAAAPDDRATTHDQAAWVRELMSQIRPEQREVLELAIDRGMSHCAIAESLSLPLGTVKAHARRGLMRLRELADHERSPLAKGVAR